MSPPSDATFPVLLLNYEHLSLEGQDELASRLSSYTNTPETVACVLSPRLLDLVKKINEQHKRDVRNGVECTTLSQRLATEQAQKRLNCVERFTNRFLPALFMLSARTLTRRSIDPIELFGDCLATMLVELHVTAWKCQRDFIIYSKATSQHSGDLASIFSIQCDPPLDIALVDERNEVGLFFEWALFNDAKLSRDVHSKLTRLTTLKVDIYDNVQPPVYLIGVESDSKNLMTFLRRLKPFFAQLLCMGCFLIQDDNALSICILHRDAPLCCHLGLLEDSQEDIVLFQSMNPKDTIAALLAVMQLHSYGDRVDASLVARLREVNWFAMKSSL